MHGSLIRLETCVAQSWARSGARGQASGAYRRVLDLLVERHGLDHPSVAEIEATLHALTTPADLSSD